MKLTPVLPNCSNIDHRHMNEEFENVPAKYICDMCGYNFCVNCIDFNVVPGKHFCNFKCAYDVSNIIKNKIDEWLIAFKELKK